MLQLSHGVVSHKKEEWSLVKSVLIYTSDGGIKTAKLKHGTQVADGAWGEVKSSYPHSIHSSDHKRIAEYVNSWAWRARRHGDDLFKAFGESIRE